MCPVYLHTQATLSFASEPGHGGYLDSIEIVTDTADWTALINLAANLPAGSRSVTFDTASGTLAVGNYIALGATATGSQEIRKISSLGTYNGTAATGTVYLDYPTGFFHADNEVLDEKTVNSANVPTGNSFLTFLPGVYETITVPDQQNEITPHYFLGTASRRNPYIYLRGRQAFEGSLPNFILLNGFPLRFPFGRVRTVATAVSGGSSTNSAATNRGQRTLPITDGTNFANGDLIEIERGGTNPEVRQIISGAGGIGAQTFILNYPLMLTHANGLTVSEATSGTTFTHTIIEDNELDSISWHVLFRDTGETAANDIIRRYVGGLVGRATIGAREGELLMMSWDSVPFLDMVHNQPFHSSIGGGTTEITKSSQGLIAPTGIGGSIPHSGGALGTATYPTTEPYYFSQGTLSFFGQTLARIRDFRIDVNNNLDPRYYIRDDGTTRIPAEIQEQRREYRMTATIALPDSIAATATTRTLFKELILEGNYGSGMNGMNIVLTFTRGTSDTITITIPSGGAAGTGGDAQGAFILTAAHDITADSPISVPVNITFRNISTVVVDSIGTYP